MHQLRTIGVYGFDASSFLDSLNKGGVSMLLDVRQRRGVRGTQYAWANSQRLQASLAAAGIGYWPDGSKDPSEKDYGPDWPAVRELDEGHFTYGARPSTQRRHRFLGINLGAWRKMCTERHLRRHLATPGGSRRCLAPARSDRQKLLTDPPPPVRFSTDPTNVLGASTTGRLAPRAADPLERERQQPQCPKAPSTPWPPCQAQRR